MKHRYLIIAKRPEQRLQNEMGSDIPLMLLVAVPASQSGNTRKIINHVMY
jgi:hypothetical protein